LSRRPCKKLGLRIPVFVMRRFFNYLGDYSCGIEIHHGAGDHPLHSVTMHFDHAAEAAGAYRALQVMFGSRSEGTR